MAQLLKPTPNATYKTRENAQKAVEKLYGTGNEFSYLIVPDDKGRFYPVCIGNAAIQHRTFIDFYTCN